jgi:hypothetical protein
LDSLGHGYFSVYWWPSPNAHSFFRLFPNKERNEQPFRRMNLTTFPFSGLICRHKSFILPAARESKEGKVVFELVTVSRFFVNSWTADTSSISAA